MIIKVFKKTYDVQDLSKIGINNYAFDLVSAIEFMYECVENKIRILGGDIINIKNGKASLSYDNWYSQNFVAEESLIDALNFLRHYYETKKGESWKIAITIDK